MIPTFESPVQAAAWWIDRGFSPVPIPAGGKDPGKLNGKEWEKLRIGHTNVEQYFNGKALNIGILLGLGGACDCDLDFPEAEKIAPAYLLTPTTIWGHGAQPRSHYLYRCHDGKTKQFRDPLQPDKKKNMVAEFRALKSDGGVGLQSVAAPGIHYSGEKIEFFSADAPATVAPDVLLGALSKIAACALLAHHWPAHGRHDAMLAMAGILARAKWPAEEAKKFCRELYSAVATGDPSQLQRSDSEVQSTFEKFSAGEEVTGFPSLIKLIDQRVVGAALDWLGIESKTQLTGWRTQLLRASVDGPTMRTLAHATIAFRESPELAGAVAFDEFAGRTAALRSTPWRKETGPWTDDDDLHAAEWLQLQGIGVSARTAAEAVQTVAGENRFHPVRQYLESLVWDEISRAELWLAAYFEVPETPYSRAVASRWLISAVARIFQAGCRADHVLVLHGAQGVEKSTGLRVLAGDAWFSDCVADLSGSGKDARGDLAGKWIVELSELSAIRRAEVERVKAFLSCRVDHYRPSYGRRAQDFPRQCVFAATSNADRPFTDETGNRRFWSVNCGHVSVEALADVRDQLWAEAVHRYRRGDVWWLETAALNALAEAEQRERFEVGARDDLIRKWAEHPRARELTHEWDAELDWFGSEPNRINVTDCLVHGLGVDPAQIRPADAREIARCLRFLGYTQVQERSGKNRGTRFFVKPATPPENSSQE